MRPRCNEQAAHVRGWAWYELDTHSSSGSGSNLESAQPHGGIGSDQGHDEGHRPGLHLVQGSVALSASGMADILPRSALTTVE